jgi:hexosaminidase
LTLSIIPRPASIKVGDGFFLLDSSVALRGIGTTPEEARALGGVFRSTTGLLLEAVAADGQADKLIVLSLDNEVRGLGDEGYRLRSTKRTVEITAKTREGIAYGLQTLAQLISPPLHAPDSNGVYSIPAVEIEDYPRFRWRGAMLDVARYFMPKEFLIKFIDLLALHKLNVLHLHLTDDQGWRIEIRKYPRLTEIGSRRKATLVGHLSASPGNRIYDNVPHGGYYTQAEIRELVRYAADRCITIVPEIDMPGHMQAAIASYPEIGVLSAPVEVATEWGVKEHILNPTSRTIAFVQDILAEIMELFPSEYIHVGGDEAVKTQWQNSAEVQKMINDLGVADENELQSYFIRQMGNYLRKHGRSLVGWDEIMEGGVAEGAVVMSWRGIEGGTAAAKQGHDVVMAPNEYTYLDYYQSKNTDAEPLAIGGYLPLSKVYAYDPVPAELDHEAAGHILGVQGQIWTEYIAGPDQVEYMAFPRLCALSEVAWTPKSARDYRDFSMRLPAHLKRLDARNVKYRPVE